MHIFPRFGHRVTFSVWDTGEHLLVGLERGLFGWTGKGYLSLIPV